MFGRHKELTLKLLPREDGGIRIWCEEVPGLILSGSDPQKVMSDVIPALNVLAEYEKDLHRPV